MTLEHMFVYHVDIEIMLIKVSSGEYICVVIIVVTLMLRIILVRATVVKTLATLTMAEILEI